MDQEMTRPVWRCTQCKKPFDQESSLKRHGYYCRSKSRVSGSNIRPRSCISCARGKLRCDHKRPECSRCMLKGISCQYPAKATDRTVSTVSHVDFAPLDWLDDTLATPTSETDLPGYDNLLAGDVGTILDSNLAMPFDSNLTESGGEDFGWNDLNLDSIPAAALPASDKVIGVPLPELSPFTFESMSSTSQTTEWRNATAFSNMSIPRTLPLVLRSFVERPRPETGKQRIANLVLHTLKSYPLMVLRQNTLPPFIHPLSVSPIDGSDPGNSLDSCINLIHMFNAGMRGGRKLFWKNVRWECQRMLEDYMTFDRWELLAAMQALCLYIVIRLDEGETEHTNFDPLIVAAVTMLAKQYNRSDTTQSSQYASMEKSLDTTWRDWIFMESGRRLCVFFRVVNMLVDFEPSTACDLATRNLVLAPLPSEKQLWAASDEFAWKRASESKSISRKNFGVATSGELVRLKELSPCCDETRLPERHCDSTATWEEWCSGMDEYGGLVMLAASLTA